MIDDRDQMDVETQEVEQEIDIGRLQNLKLLLLVFLISYFRSLVSDLESLTFSLLFLVSCVFPINFTRRLRVASQSHTLKV
jgi:hypothetical protein